MGNNRPQFTIEKSSSNAHLFSVQPYDKTPQKKQIDDYVAYEYHASKTFIFPTYEKLKNVMRKIMSEYNANEVTVIRSRRGQWGEWFEIWEKAGSRKRKLTEGWM